MEFLFLLNMVLQENLGYGHDEINVILKGKNYGWPNVVGNSFDKKFVNPLIS